MCDNYYKSILFGPSVTCQPAALEEEDEAEDEEPTAELKKTVDEPEDKKEEDDEDDDGEKATVDVIKPVPEPEEETAKAEPAGQRAIHRSWLHLQSFLLSVELKLHDL